MIVRNLMNSDCPFARVDDDLGYVAQLLAECGLGLVPVVDDKDQPIGVVTRSNLEEAVANAPELGDIPSFLLRDRTRRIAPPKGRSLRDVMTTPVVSASAGAKLEDIAQLMAAHHLKRLPLVDGHKLVGVVLRKSVIDAINGVQEAPSRPILTLQQPHHTRPVSATADEFRALVAAHEQQAESERADRKRIAQELRDQRIKDLAERRLSEAHWRDMMHAARHAAEAGFREHLLIRFPSRLCVDGGRAINAPDPHWPETLRGEPADIFRRYRDELQLHGFKIAAQIIDFPDGLPGDAALFLIWGAEN